MKYIARRLTVGRLLIIGEKGRAIRRCITSQKAALEASKKRSVQNEAKTENYRFGKLMLEKPHGVKLTLTRSSINRTHDSEQTYMIKCARLLEIQLGKYPRRPNR